MKETFIASIRNSRFIKNLIKVSFMDLTGYVISGFTMILFIKLLSKNSYGDFTLYTTIAFLISGILAKGLSTSYVRYNLQLSENDRNKGLFNISVAIVFSLHLLMFLFVVGFSKQISEIIFKDNNKTMVLALSIVYGLSLSLQFLLDAYFQSRDMYTKAGISLIVKNLVSFIIMVILFFTKTIDLLTLLLFYTFANFIVPFTISLFLIIKSFNNNLYRIQLKIIKSFLHRSLWTVLYYLFLSITININVFIINTYLPKDELADYGVAMKYYAVGLALFTSIINVYRVRVSKNDITESVDNQRHFVKAWLKNSIPLMGVLFILLFWGSKILFPILNGEEYNNAILLFQILCVGIVLKYIFGPNIYVLLSKDKYKTLCVFSFFSLILTLLLSLLFISKYGVIAAAIIIVLIESLRNIFATIYVMKDKTG
jgi:O-antigen/teichoic acid export membrane protein